jgi:hypothetical protein
MHNNNSMNTDSAQVLPVGRNLWLLFFVALLLCLASAVSQAQANPLDVRIDFDSNKCPTAATPELGNLSASGINKIMWTAYNSSDAADRSINFEIFFDPFRGQPLASANGVKKSPPINTKTPKKSKNAGGNVQDFVEFKYTIVGVDCSTGVSLDPRLKVSQ